MENNKIEIVGIDHGWSNMKTTNSVFTSGVKEITTEPALFDNVVEFEGKYFKVGGKRLEVKDTKVTDENYYILTLASIGKELSRRGLRRANVLLSVGLPLTRFGAEKKDFIDYLMKRKEISFKFENVRYNVIIERVSVFPQCYAAVADRLGSFRREVLVVDIGSWTVDIMPISNQKPDIEQCVTLPKGLITCMRAINEQCVRQLGGQVTEADIQEVMMCGRSDIATKYLDVIQEGITEFARSIYFSLKEYGYNLETMPIIFVGGGATVMKLFGNIKQGDIKYIEDVKANAKGFEYLARVFLATNKRVG
ncbi:MAG TPA: ParM/StbA family protein [Mobilitalea sp.]|nr:ParM/StbA family protein [Mobilitalea sp.]